LLDEVEVFNRALSPSEIAAIANAGSAGKCPPATISGHVGSCITPATNVPGVSLNVTGSQTTSTVTDASGNYSINLPTGGSYTLTPVKTALPAGSGGISTIDVLSAQSQYLGRTTLSGCRLTAADANGDASVNTLDVVAIQRFFLGLGTGTANVGQWSFSPASRSYANLAADQSAQNYDALVMGDINGDLMPSAPDSGQGNPAASARVVAASPSGAPPSTVSLPTASVSTTLTNFTVPVATTTISAVNNLIGFQGDFTFDSSVVTFQGTPASAAGLTATNWNVSANVLGAGTIKTLRLSAFSNDFTPLSGSGRLFNLNFTRVSNTVGANTALTWANSPNNFQFIDAMLNTSAPASTPAGSISIGAAPTATRGTISGRILSAEGTPVSGAVVNLSGTQARKTITDANGNYTFAEVESNGLYTVTPARANYTFSPASRSFSLLGARTEAGFTAAANGERANAIDTAEFFVRQQYLDFLGREPDESGFNFWSEQILSCGSDAACLERRTINVSAAYFLSIEFQNTGGLVDGLYRASYGRAPHYGEFLPDRATVARNVVVGRADWAAQLEANKQAFVEAWVQRADFRMAYDGLENGAYVDSLISRAGGFNGDRAALVSGLNSGNISRAAGLRQIVENEGVSNARHNAAFVMMEYFGYLRRDPDESGYQFWLNKLNQFAGNFEQAEMVKAFLVSSEYRNRFRQ